MQRVRKTKKPVIITDRGVPVTAMIDIEEFEDFLFLRQPEYVASLKRALDQSDRGEVVPMEEVFARLLK